MQHGDRVLGEHTGDDDGLAKGACATLWEQKNRVFGVKNGRCSINLGLELFLLSRIIYFEIYYLFFFFLPFTCLYIFVC